MNPWIANDTTLRGETVELRPLALEHFEELIERSKDDRIWEFYILNGADTTRYRGTLEAALEQRDKGNQFPFVIYHKQTQKLIGSTRFMDMNHEHRKLEIGWTWLHPEFWATEVNFECKLLLLRYCFDVLHTVRVAFKTDETNKRSQKAITKIGGVYEGILRHDLLRDNGTYRNSMIYSILDTEWEKVQPMLTKLYSDKKGQ
ncbi:MAG: GNAT family protein [Candidatus Kapaibacterium sp.]